MASISTVRRASTSSAGCVVLCGAHSAQSFVHTCPSSAHLPVASNFDLQCLCTEKLHIDILLRACTSAFAHTCAQTAAPVMCTNTAGTMSTRLHRVARQASTTEAAAAAQRRLQAHRTRQWPARWHAATVHRRCQPAQPAQPAQNVQTAQAAGTGAACWSVRGCGNTASAATRATGYRSSTSPASRPAHLHQQHALVRSATSAALALDTADSVSVSAACCHAPDTSASVSTRGQGRPCAAR